MLSHASEDEVRRLLTPRAAREVVRDVLIAAARGETRCPVRTTLALASGWFAAMPAFVGAETPALGVKLVSAYPGNAAHGLATHAAIVVLFDPETGLPAATVSGDTITERRTAAASVIATERLARRPYGALAVLGAGVQGRAHVVAFADAGLIGSLRVWSRTHERAAALVAEARGLGVRASLATTPEEAVCDADVVVTATGSSEPLFAADALRDGVHVNAVGACVPERRELPASLVAAADLYADDVAAIRREAGDLLLAERDLGRPLEVRDSLGALLAEPARAVGVAKATIFESLGLGIEDVACAAYVLRSRV